MAFDRDLHVRRAIWHEAYRISLRSQLRRPLLEAKYLLVKATLAALKARRDFIRYRLNMVFYARVHARRLSRLFGSG